MLPKTVSRKTQNMNLKPLLLILGNLYGDDIMNDPLLKESVDYIRKLSPHHITMMLEVGTELNALARQGTSVKKINARNFVTIIEFQQSWTQGIWNGEDPLLQLPHFDHDVVKKVRKSIKDFKLPNASIEGFCRLTKADRASMKLFDD